MNRFQVGFAKSAEAQADAIDRWWIENRPAAPGMFRRELDAMLRLLEVAPLIGKLYPEAPMPGVRRILIGASRYHLYWEVDAAARTVMITAVWYAGRGSGPRL